MNSKISVNIGKLDIILRFIMGIGFIGGGFYMALPLSNVWGLLVAFMGVMMIFTAMMKWCPFYSIFGIASCPLHK